MTHTFCDGSTIRFRPKYQRYSECYECGARYKLKTPILLNQPKFHKGPFKEASKTRSKCLACNKTFLDFFSQCLKIFDLRLPKIMEQFEKTDKFYEMLTKGKVDIISSRGMRVPLDVKPKS